MQMIRTYTALIKYGTIVGLLLMLLACSNSFLQPMKQHIASPEQFGIAYEDIYIEDQNKPALHGWWFRSVSVPAKASVLFLHGNAENISTHAGLIYWLTQYGYDVLIVDYRGYGKSAGRAELSGSIDDIGRARDYLVKRVAGANRCFVIGHSLGASMAIYSLADDASGLSGAVLVSAFSEYPAIASEMLGQTTFGWLFQWLPWLLVSGQFDAIDVVAGIHQIPKLFVYSADDRVIALSHGEALYQAATEPKYWLQVAGGHNRVFANETTQQLILEYLDRWSVE